jgi:putative membrane-bound dehydrogenase-like protein
MADGLAPLDAAKAMSAAAGFSVKLLAAEPDVRQPIGMCFDDRGRLWVVECYAYPSKVPAADARDRILIFEDTDGDHVLDSRKVFFEGLNLASGIAVGFGGVWVGAAPDFMFFPDADGDDVPDGKPQILLDGWGAQDTHETLNSFIWGPDGWLYGCHGVFTHSAVGKPGTPEADRVRINAGIWRYHPVRHEFEVFSEGTSNPWGVDFNDLGHAFQTACVIPHLYHVIPGARYQRQAGQHFNPYTFDDIKTIARHRHWSGSHYQDVRHAVSDGIGGGHAHSGACIYLGGSWPEQHRGTLFMNNIHGARLNEDRLTPSGSGYVGDGEPDFLFANDSWSQFVSLQVGPDGQMVLIDWYDRTQCHQQRDAVDRGNGRIFKVIYGQASPVRVDLARESDAKLVDLLGHDNDWFVRHARRLLQERAAAGRLAADTPGLLEQKLAASTTTPKKLRLVWAMHVTGQLDEKRLLGFLGDSDPAVRGWAIQLAAEGRNASPRLLERFVELAADDPSPVVRLALAAACQRIPSADRRPICAALVRHDEDAGDHNLPLMYWYAIEPLVPLDIPRALALAATSRIPTVSRFIVRRAAFDEAGYGPLVDRLVAADSATRTWMLEEILAAIAARGRMAVPPAWQRGWERLATDPDEGVRRLAGLVAARLGDPQVVPRLRAIIADQNADRGRRREALQALVSVKDEQLPPLLQKLVTDPALQADAIAALAAVPHDDTPAAVIGGYEAMSSAGRQAAIAALISRPAWVVELLDAIAAGRVPRGELSAFTVGRLAEAGDEGVRGKVAAIWGTVRPTPASRNAEFTKWRYELGSAAMKKADLANGRATFAKTCGGCHQLHGEGGRIGPDLTGSNRADLDYLLANLLDPSGIVGRDYQTTIVVTEDGRSIAGIVVEETPTSVSLQTPTERVVVPLDEIETRVLSPQSLMPENQLSQLSPDAARDLIAYLRHPTQVPLPPPAP